MRKTNFFCFPHHAARTAGTHHHRDVPDLLGWCWATKAGGKEEVMFRAWHFWSQGTIPCESPALLNLPGHGKREWIPCCALPVCAALALPVRLSWSQLTNFLPFALTALHPILVGPRSGWGGLTCRDKLWLLDQAVLQPSPQLCAQWVHPEEATVSHPKGFTRQAARPH